MYVSAEVQSWFIYAVYIPKCLVLWVMGVWIIGQCYNICYCTYIHRVNRTLYFSMYTVDAFWTVASFLRTVIGSSRALFWFFLYTRMPWQCNLLTSLQVLVDVGQSLLSWDNTHQHSSVAFHVKNHIIITLEFRIRKTCSRFSLFVGS